MSVIKGKKLQLGYDGTASNNFTLYQPGTPDGTLRLANGIAGAETDVVTLTSAGNVGIGTSSPAARLDIGSGNLNFSSTAQRITGDFSNATIANRVLFQTRTKNAQTVIEAIPNGTSLNSRFVASSSSSDPANSSIFDLAMLNATDARLSSSIRGTGTYLPMTFYTGGSERMRIDSSGNVSIGTTGTSGKFTVVQGNGVASDISNTNTNDVLALWGNKGNSSSSAMYIIPIRSGDSTLRGSIYWTGSTIQYNTSSDYRLKENIAPMTGALSKVLQLKPVTYKWKESGFDGQGFIAHELQEVIPDCVSGEKDAVDEEGKPVYQGVDTSFLVATLTAAIQEQQTIINDLKARIETLESNNV